MFIYTYLQVLVKRINELLLMIRRRRLWSGSGATIWSGDAALALPGVAAAATRLPVPGAASALTPLSVAGAPPAPSGTAGTGSGSATTSTTPARVTHLNSAPGSAYLGTVETGHGVLRVPWVLHLHEGKAWRLTGHPRVPHRTVLGKAVLNVVPVGIIPQPTDEDLALDIPIPMRHCRCQKFLFWKMIKFRVAPTDFFKVNKSTIISGCSWIAH